MTFRIVTTALSGSDVTCGDQVRSQLRRADRKGRAPSCA